MGTDEMINSSISIDYKTSQNELDGSDESLNSVFEDSSRLDVHERCCNRRLDRIGAGHGIKICLNDLPDPNDIHRSLSTSCIPVAVDVEQREVDGRFERCEVANNPVRNQSQFLNVNSYERGRSSSYREPKERIFQSKPNLSRSRIQSDCDVPYIVVDCPCSGSRTLYRSSSNLCVPQDEQVYQRRVVSDRESVDSGITNAANHDSPGSSRSMHLFSASAPSSRRNSFIKEKKKKTKSASDIIEEPISHSLSTNTIECEGTFTNVSKEGFNDSNSMILHLVVPRSMTSDVNSTHMIGSNQRSSSLDNVLIQNPNPIVSDETNTARKMEGRSFSRLVDEVQTPHSRLSSTNSNSKNSPEMEEIRKKVFRKWLTVILSCVYATFVVMLGLVIYVADLMQATAPFSELFNIFLMVVAFIWLIFFHVDIRRFINSSKRKRKLINVAIGNDNDRNKTTPNQLSPAPDSNKVPHSYCFMSGRHSGSFFLKIGAAAFCFGHLIHYGLLLSRQIVYFTAEDRYRQPCANLITLILDIILPMFSFYQLFMIFKYSNVVIRRYCEASRFALMHIIASNVCIWINTIIRETVESIQSKMVRFSQMNISSITSPPPFDALATSTASNAINERAAAVDFFGFLKFQDICISKTILSAFTLQASPYLYPFTIEYSLLVAGVWFIIWFNVDNTDNCCQRGQLKETCNMSRVDSGDFTSNLVIHVDCHSANRGLFAGLFVLLAIVVSVIIFFVAMMNKDYIRTGMIINTSSDLILLLTMSLSVLFAYRQTVKLDVNNHAVTFLDDILLFIALPCFFLYGIFNVVAGMTELAPISIIASILSVVQVILQTPFIIDGLRRCSNSQELRYKKPGREIITFLVVCNLAMWILETFEIKSAEAHYDQFKFYGKYLWTILSHITLPLTLFYRFHSSVCLVDIWKSAYEPGE